MLEQEAEGSAGWSGVIRAGAVLFVVEGFGGLLQTFLGAWLYSSGMPSDATAYLQLYSAHQALAALTWSLWIVGDFMFIVPTVAMYVALRPVSRGLALVGSLLSGVFIVFDICVTELNSLTLVGLAHGYAAASDSLRAPYVAAATYAAAALPIETVFSFAVGAAGWLLWSLVMLRPEERVFGRRTGMAGVLVNCLGILGGVGALVAAFSLFTFLTVPLTGLWFIVLGVQLGRRSRRLQTTRLRSGA
jgi:hypothetical protein